MARQEVEKTGRAEAATTVRPGGDVGRTARWGWPVAGGAGLAAAGGLWLRTGRALLPVALLSALATSAGLVTLLKIVIGRPRPPANLVIGAPARSDAFPSGHTTNGSVTYVLAALLLALTVTRPAARRAILAAALVVALLIGWSRL